MDSSPHGQRQRIQHALLVGHRRHAGDFARRLAGAGRAQPPRKRGALDPALGGRLSAAEAAFQAEARRLYDERIELGVAREQARKDLPLSTYTEAYWKVDLHNLLHFLALRMDHHAQEEIRLYAPTMGEQIVRPLFPLVWEAFVDYRLEGMFLSRLEREVISRLALRLAQSNRGRASQEDFLAVQDPSWVDVARSRERDECREKLVRLGLLAGHGCDTGGLRIRLEAYGAQRSRRTSPAQKQRRLP